jgi:hypothetical protein
MCQSQQQPTDILHGVSAQSPLSSYHSAQRLRQQVDRQSKPIDPYVLPSTSELKSLLNHFVATVGMVFPYIDKASLLHHGGQLSQGAIWETSKPGRALVNIICAHAAFGLGSAEAELFYRRTLLLLDELTIRGSSVELGMLSQSGTCLFDIDFATERRSTSAPSVVLFPAEHAAIYCKLDVPRDCRQSSNPTWPTCAGMV